MHRRHSPLAQGNSQNLEVANTRLTFVSLISQGREISAQHASSAHMQKFVLTVCGSGCDAGVASLEHTCSLLMRTCTPRTLTCRLCNEYSLLCAAPRPACHGHTCHRSEVTPTRSIVTKLIDTTMPGMRASAMLWSALLAIAGLGPLVVADTTAGCFHASWGGDSSGNLDCHCQTVPALIKLFALDTNCMICIDRSTGCVRRHGHHANTNTHACS